MAELREGAPAPELDFITDWRRKLSLSTLQSHIVVLYFYPKDDTPGCTKEAIAFSEKKAEFEALGARIIGVSKDSPDSHNRFKAKHGFELDLATAESDEALEPWGAWVEKSMYGKRYMGIDRMTVLIDKEGVVRRIWRKVKVPGHVEEVLAAVKALS
ncbi:MAG: peroxiredoxin [Pseudomonadota bacterium]|nr:peroxiredoxin [Pseudomonadota bacterium]